MSGRGRRARGRPPKTPLPTNRTNFLRKPKAYQARSEASSNPSSRCSTPISIPGTPTRGRGRSRDAAQRGRHFMNNLFDEDDASRSSVDPEEKGSDVADDIEPLEDDSDSVYEDSDSDFSDDSYSTQSSTGKRKLLFFRRPKTPELLDDKDIPQLDLPSSSSDLLIPTESLMMCLGVYEVIRHFRVILRLSPFTFEDFCAALLSDEVSTLLIETHMTLLRSLLREEDGNNTTFGPTDLKDSINVSLYFIDSMTWPELVRSYLDSDRLTENKEALQILDKSTEYPFVSFLERLKVLKVLTDLFLSTNSVREEIMNEGNIHYDDHCRACHKLGDLLCCETCSAVYHLACVEPPMEEVPEEDWVCTICKAHKVKGVTDCASEAEKSGLLCRQEPIGFDRHRRKYWFLCRRIVVESETEAWYYSTQPQFEELLEVLDKNNYERDLYQTLLEFKEDILKHMSITEELTNSHKGNRKSALEIEIAQLKKTQTERVLKKAKEEEERKAKEIEEAKQREEEKMEKEVILLDGPEMNGDINENSNSKQPGLDSSVVEEVVISEENTVTATTSEVTSSQSIMSEAKKMETSVQQVVETVTTTTIKTISSTKVTNSEEGMETESGDQSLKPEDEIVLQEKNGQDPTSELKSFEIKKLDKTPDGVKSTIMNVQSVCPNVKPTVLKVTEDSPQKSPQTRTVLIVNRDGNRVTLAVSKQPITTTQGSEGIDTVVTQNSTENTTVVSSSDARRIVTRSKTGSLTPKQFTDSVTSTTASVKTRSSDDVLVINKDGDITRVTRSKSALMMQQSVYYKLGMENNFKTYQNQYSSNQLALNKHQHNEERDKRRYLSHKFSLTQLSEFKWNGAVVGRKNLVTNTLMMTLTQLENNIPTAFLHPHWPLHRQNWNNAVQLCRSPSDFGLALSILEACLKPVIFNPVWTEALGHSKLMKITSLDREEMKKREKEMKKRKDEEEESRGPLIWIKYTLGLKHQVWKQRGEEYRVTGGQGWLWLSKTRRGNHVSQDSVGLRNVARKLRARKRKAEEEQDENQDAKVEETAVKKIKEENPDTEGTQAEKMDTDEKPVEANAEDSGNHKMEVDEEKCEKGENQGTIKTEQVVTIDVENSSPVKNVKVANDEKTGKTARDSPLTSAYKDSSLPPKADVDLINVSKGMNERTYYQKVTKPYAKLDSLLVKRLKQEEIEIKQRQALQQQINWKLKSQIKSESAPLSKSIKQEEVKTEESKPFTDTTPSEETPDLPSHPCYSYLCRSEEGSCYSCLCMQKQSQDEAMLNLAAEMDCQWTIGASNGFRIMVDVREYIIEDGEGADCVYDSLRFYDGANTGAQVTSVCGTARSGRMFVSSGPAALLRLTSDYSIQQAGFTMRYIMTKTDDHGGCGTATPLTATSTVQYITNKQWPDSYDENSLCRWTITSTGKVSMTILFSDMLSGEECYSDTLEIFDGSSRTDPSLTQGYFCDSRGTFPSRSSMTFVTSGTQAFIRFRSIASGWRRHGFLLSFVEVPGAVTTTQAPTTTTTQPPNEVCSSGTVQLTANNDTQLIQSPSYPIFYSPNMLCSWLITAPTGALIQLKVIDSYLEDTDGCVGDYVHIHDGSNADSAVIATYCGEISSSVNSTSNRLYIQFRTDGSVGQRGFQLEYTVLYDYSAPSCAPPAGVTNLEANATAQYFESPNYPDNYNSSSTFYWLIHNPSDTGYIRLEVEDSRIEADPYCTYDKVTVYRGPCTTYPVLSSFCGVEKPTVTQYTGSYVLVVFTTDATADFRGFRIKYYVTTEVEKTSTFWRDVALIAGATIAGIAAVAIIVGLAVAAKRGKLPGMKSSGPKKRRLSVSSLSSSSSSSDESDKESSNKRKRPKTALRSKTKVRLPPVKSAKVETLPKVSIKGQSKLPPIVKK